MAQKLGQGHLVQQKWGQYGLHEVTKIGNDEVQKTMKTEITDNKSSQQKDNGKSKRDKRRQKE